MRELFKKHKVILCMGTGGVGKTTCSAALGVLAARLGFRTLVLTIDPAQRLAQAMNVENPRGLEAPVKDVPGLSACMIDPRLEFDNFVRGNVENRIAEGLFRNPLYRQLIGNLNGSQEFTSLIRVHESVKSGKYDLVILDTPPAQNSIDFLRAPDRIYALFQDSVIGWFTPQQKGNWMNRIMHRGTAFVMAALERVTGSQFITELKDFFAHISHLQVRVTEVSMQVHHLIRSNQTGILLITGFDETKLKEASEIQIELNRENLNLSAVIINRAFPTWADCGSGTVPTALSDLYDQMTRYYKDRLALYDQFAQQPLPILKLPDYNQAVVGIPQLSELADQIQSKWEQFHA